MFLGFFDGVVSLIAAVAMWLAGQLGSVIGGELRHFAYASQNSLNWTGIIMGGLLAAVGFYLSIKNIGLLSQVGDSKPLLRLLTPWRIYMFFALFGLGMGLFFGSS